MIKKNKKLMMMLAGSLLALSANASIDSSQLSSECKAVVHALHHLASSKSEDACSGDLLVAASYIDVAGERLKQGKYNPAYISITYGELELKQISWDRSYCSHFSPRVKPILADVITLKSRIEDLNMRMK